ncbi:unannotated protein [freshwater metagenome]|uniref:Unannotated protein n=1 Tax=freshwater metagenome TaxID=449393 RepID=A0A6J7F8C8_9ZZZZ|nr:Rieske 2Fe-2S domain-containing protein [Actinomycetota bacterium]MSW15028.1 Rieske 2Fe-2S domain-containing protein [Actinomycetota bacterium]MSW98647.1 Rieske 2Fe-2S domain-containing protein [Actinomycetota bacterium]MSZ45746.1 Rieske 2Fe-2S domain-containing protein [Actinomycetota bacterium]MTA05035.1 Rieske 2Fe-2S domain-containing protein [Actinomycetota bacterium]
MLNSWKNQHPATTVLRLWLGITFIYGGWNKATDPGFLDQGSPHYIGAQITGYLSTSPIDFILKHMIEHATLMGWGVMITEFAIGFGVLAGYSLELLSLAGVGLSATLWLSATWSVKPYFLGSDTAYMVLWLALFLLVRGGKSGRNKSKLISGLTDRREVLRLAGVGVLGVVATFSGRIFKNSNPNPESGLTITTVATFPVGSTMNFQAASGEPAVLFRTNAGVFAYSAICTHQGCNVAYDSGKNLLKCPCHGAEFDPAQGAKVITGPAQTPLASIKVAIKGDKIVQI